MDTYAPDPQTRKRKIECKPELVIASLQRFYSSQPEINKVLAYLNGDAPLSLRIIDWFVTKYSRKNFVRYQLNGQEFLVYLSYKGQLKAYSKQYFDPNCRRERIMFKISNQDPFLTTIGKLNFFRWAMETRILDYIEENQEDIKRGYNAYLKESIHMQKRNKNETTSSTDSSISIASAMSAMSDASTLTGISATSDGMASYLTLNSNGTRTTRRRRTKQTPSSLNKLQIYNNVIQLEFN